MKTLAAIECGNYKPGHRGHGRLCRPCPQHGFTLIELLIVIAIIAILAAMLLPVLAKAKAKAEGIECLNDLKQLNTAWLMYAADNQGHLVRNADEAALNNVTGYNDPSLVNGTNAEWCPGRQDEAQLNGVLYLSPDGTPLPQNFGLLWIQAGLLYPYVNNVKVYKCPADISFVPFGGRQLPHVRSYSMNGCLGPVTPWNNDTTPYYYYTEASLRVPGPANLMVFIDENPGSINDGYFLDAPDLTSWYDYPATTHDNASGMGFADGHAEMHRWRDGAVLDDDKGPTGGQPQQTPPTDLNWIQSVISVYASQY